MLPRSGCTAERISVARSALSASVSAKRYRVAPDVVQHEVSVSLGIVGTIDGVRMARPSLDLAILYWVYPYGDFRVRAGFDSRLGDCGDRTP